MKRKKFGRYGHHPDPTIDAEVQSYRCRILGLVKDGYGPEDRR